jgi:hypothetical protein
MRPKKRKSVSKSLMINLPKEKLRKPKSKKRPESVQKSPLKE